MGKPTGFLEFERKNNESVEPKERIKNFNEFHEPLPAKERQCQAARCMDCGDDWRHGKRLPFGKSCPGME